MRPMKALLVLSLAVTMWTLSGCQQVKELLMGDPVEECRPSKIKPDKDVCVKIEYKDKVVK